MIKKISFFVFLWLATFSLGMAQNMPKLKKGDKIAFVAPSWKVSPSQLSTAILFFEQNGFEVVLSPHIYDKQNQFAGSDEQRRADLQLMLDDTTIKAIMCVRGGYGAVRFVDELNFDAFRQHPKWLCGFSDVTVIHSQLQALGYPSLHSVMPITIKKETIDNQYNKSLLQALRGDSLHYEFAAHDSNRVGTADGLIVGGNLSILYSLLASPSDLNTDGKILFIEDTDEYLYHIDRMMWALKRAGKLENLQGLVVGCMNKMHDSDTPFGQDVINIIRTVCADYDFPICFDFPAGHCGQNFALPLGTHARLDVTPAGCTLEFNNNN